MKYQTRNTLANKAAREQFQRKSKLAFWRVAAMAICCIFIMAACGIYSPKTLSNLLRSLIKYGPHLEDPNDAAENISMNELPTSIGLKNKFVTNPLIYPSSDMSNNGSAISIINPITLIKTSTSLINEEKEPSAIEMLLNSLNNNSSNPVATLLSNPIASSSNDLKPKNTKQSTTDTIINPFKGPNVNKKRINHASLPSDFIFAPEVVTLNNITFHYQNISASPAGVVFVAHGCRRPFSVWWPKSVRCIACQGMPVERKILRKMLQSNYLFVTASPIKLSGKSDCWHKDDAKAISAAITLLYEHIFGPLTLADQSSLSQTHLKAPPLHLISVANGVQLIGQLGLHSSRLIPRLPLTSLIIIVGGIWEDDYLFPVNKTAKPFPPTLFIDTSRNSDLALHNKEFVAKITAAHGPHYSSQLVSDPIRLDPLYFHTEGSVLTANQSRTLFDKLQMEHAIWPCNNRLLMDPFIHAQGKKLYEWTIESIPEVVPYHDDLKYPLSPLLELLIVAYGNREISGLFTGDVVTWMDSFNI